MKQTAFSLTIFTAALLTAFSAQANPTVEKNGVLTNKEGRSLYIFDKDSAGKSNCSGGCVATWPAFTVANAAAADADFTIIKREDGAQQWAYKGMPMYFFAGDSKPGDMNGDNQGGVWHLARSGGKPVAAAAKDSAPAYKSTY